MAMDSAKFVSFYKKLDNRYQAIKPFIVENVDRMSCVNCSEALWSCNGGAVIAICKVVNKISVELNGQELQPDPTENCQYGFNVACNAPIEIAEMKNFGLAEVMKREDELADYHEESLRMGGRARTASQDNKDAYARRIERLCTEYLLLSEEEQALAFDYLRDDVKNELPKFKEQQNENRNTRGYRDAIGRQPTISKTNTPSM